MKSISVRAIQCSKSQNRGDVAGTHARMAARCANLLIIVIPSTDALHSPREPGNRPLNGDGRHGARGQRAIRILDD